MKKFIVENTFWELFPNAKIGVLTLEGFDNTHCQEERYAHMLREAEKEALEHIQSDEWIQNERIRVWRDAFQKFKTKKGARSSIEALLKRVKQGSELPLINPLVNIYNVISLKYGLPCGGEDRDAFVGDLRLALATGDEDFTALGDSEPSYPFPGELIYKDDAGAVCRCFNWREAQRTMLKEETTSAFICIECIDEKQEDTLNHALDHMGRLIEMYLGVKAKKYLLTVENPIIEME